MWLDTWGYLCWITLISRYYNRDGSCFRTIPRPQLYILAHSDLLPI